MGKKQLSNESLSDEQLLDIIDQEAQGVKVPPRLEPEQIAQQLMQQKTQPEDRQVSVSTPPRQKSTGHRFFWQSFGSRAAAAVVVVGLSLGTFMLAGRQTPDVQIGQKGQDSQTSDVQSGDTGQTAQAGNAPDGQNEQAGDTNGLDMIPQKAETDEKSETAAVSAREIGTYHQADSYEEIGQVLVQLAAKEKKEMASGAIAEAVSDETKKFSTTNLQVIGVDESDIIKTDGQYIYIASDDQVRIVDTSGGTVRQLGSIRPEMTGNLDTIREMYVAGDRLMLIVQAQDTSVEYVQQNDGGSDWDHGLNSKKRYVSDTDGQKTYVKVFVYDIQSPAGAKLTGTFTQDGSYTSSRKIGSRMYLFTDYYIDDYKTDRIAVEAEGTSTSDKESAAQQEAIKAILPTVQGQELPLDCIYLPAQCSRGGLVMASFDVYDPKTVCDRKLIFSGYSTPYVTQDSLILYGMDRSGVTDGFCTSLTKFALRDGQIIADCAEAVRGEISDTFAIHENQDGYLYVLTTDTDQTSGSVTNRLYVLDEKLKVKGSIDHIADGERVYAARFVDKIGYFVTYRNVDPLFTVDFSDPAHPALIGELELPGFSDYLQFWDDTHLIGVGEEYTADGSKFVGVKLSLYDISDPAKVKESDRVVCEDACSSPAAYNYKALLADSSKNVIAFLTDDQGVHKLSERIYAVKDGRLAEQRTECIVEGDDDSCYSDAYRNVYIGDKLYLVSADQIFVYDMSDAFSRIGEYELI